MLGQIFEKGFYTGDIFPFCPTSKGLLEQKEGLLGQLSHQNPLKNALSLLVLQKWSEKLLCWWWPMDCAGFLFAFFSFLVKSLGKFYPTAHTLSQLVFYCLLTVLWTPSFIPNAAFSWLNPWIYVALDYQATSSVENKLLKLKLISPMLIMYCDKG